VPALKEPRGAARREGDILAILNARFSLSALEEWKRNDPAWWGCARNSMGRGIHAHALREQRRLRAVTEDEIRAELAAIERGA
jgi:hypothetical protein